MTANLAEGAKAPDFRLARDGGGTVSLGDAWDLGSCNEQEHSPRVDEAANQPRASDTVDFRPGAGNPDGAPVTIRRRHFARRHQR